uniref:Uncharacterized protein n=1 Tax=uncultured bacterium fosmid pJB190D12_contig II TaxID=1478060 RepID=A0A0H3U7E8_9BACT|nr:hypothetical protein [uncultured bacterium fosmid pJB190D12_contig II]
MSFGSRKSPCPPLCEMNAPEGQIRGPGTRPVSMPRFSPNTGPPRSRTLVKPRISMSAAPFVAATLTKPTSAVRAVAWGIVPNIMWTCASMSPGISVRPPPAMRVTVAPPGAPIGAVEIDLIVLPTTSTFDGAVRRSDFPSKTRTFSNSTAFGGTWACAAGTIAHPRAHSAPHADLHRSCILPLWRAVGGEPPRGNAEGKCPENQRNKSVRRSERAARRSVRRLLRVAHRLREHDPLIGAQLERGRELAPVDEPPDHAGEAGRCAVQVDVLGDEAGVGGGEERAVRGARVTHLAEVGNVHEIERGGPDELLQAGGRPQVGMDDRLQHMAACIVAVRAVGQRREHLDLLPVVRRGRGTSAAVRPVDAECAPQQRREDVARQFSR